MHSSVSKAHDEGADRSIAFARRTCLLNGLQLLSCTVASAVVTLTALFDMCNFANGTQLLQNVYYEYVSVAQYGVLIISSNIGFFAHCYYSKMYRKAFFKVVASAKQKLRKIFCKHLTVAVAPIEVTPNKEVKKLGDVSLTLVDNFRMFYCINLELCSPQ